jgi:hypothetical protein
MTKAERPSNVGGKRQRVLYVLFGVLYIEMIACVWLLLRVLTGDNWPLGSAAISYVLVAVTRPTVERWIGSR